MAALARDIPQGDVGLEALGLPSGTRRLLEDNAIRTLDHLRKLGEEGLQELEGMDARQAAQVAQALEDVERAGEARLACMPDEGWQQMACAPTLASGSRGDRSLIQLYGDDEHDRGLRVVAGYVDRDGTAMAISPEVDFPFRARMWKHMSARPPRALR